MRFLVIVKATKDSEAGKMPSTELLTAMGKFNDELIKCVFALLKNPQERRQMALNGRQLIEQRFTWQRVAGMYEQLYRQVVREHRERVLAGLS